MLSDHVPGERTVGDRDLTQWRTSSGRGVARAFTALARAVAARTGWKVNHVALWLTALLGAVIASTATWAAAETYESIAEHDGAAVFDQPALQQAISWRTPLLDADVSAFTNLGGSVGMPIIATVLVAVLVVTLRSRLPLVLMVIAAAGALAMTAVGKAVVGRARPDHALAVPPFENSPSFPSGHTLNTTVVVGIVLYLLLPHVESRWGRVVAVVAGAAFTVAMGLSRVFLGHHWLTDVMAGWALGIAWVVLVVTAHRIFLTLYAPAARPASSRATGTRNGEQET